MTSLNEEVLRSLTTSSNVPLVFRGILNSCPLLQWDVDKWCDVFGSKELPFRCYKKSLISDEPCWERKCEVKNITFKDFVTASMSSDEWMYFDYKYVHKWFDCESEFYKNISWKQFGYDKGASDSTLWVGSSGAHTPAHQDTYGYNLVAQIFGKKRWLLFPSETGGMKPTRVPYEESSVYSELNFYCPSNLEEFNGLVDGRMVELSPGDVLLVPQGWWHYVQNLESLNIALNLWLPHEKDASSQVSEALIKIFIAQICKDLPEETAMIVVNPNEDDISETPLAVLFLQLETVANIYLDSKRKLRRAKRQKTSEEEAPSTEVEEYDLKKFIDAKSNNIEIAPKITNDELIALLKNNITEYTRTSDGASDETELDGTTLNLGLTKVLIDAFSQSNVIEVVKQNLLARLS